MHIYICIAIMTKEILLARKKGILSLKFFTSILNSVYSFIYTFFDLWIIELATIDWLLVWPLQEPFEALSPLLYLLKLREVTQFPQLVRGKVYILTKFSLTGKFSLYCPNKILDFWYEVVHLWNKNTLMKYLCS